MADEFIDATAQAELVRSGKATPTELVEEAIQRIERLNPEINAVIIPLYEKAREEAARVRREAPFAGVPYLLKDLTIVSKGDPCAAGIAGVRAAGHRSDHDSFFVERMREAGFVLLGRTNTPELGLLPTTEPAAWGPCRNPWDLSRSTGGSSGGSAAAVAAGMVAIAHGNDGGGSIRMPASLCGVVGLKPTRGRISIGPMVIESDTVSGMAIDGFLTRSVRDQAAALDIVSGHRPGDGYCAPFRSRPFTAELDADPGRLRIGVLTEDPTGQNTVDPDCVEAARRAAGILSELGHDVSAGFPPALRRGSWPEEFTPCVAVVMQRELERYGSLIGRPLTEDEVEPTTWALAQMGRSVTGAQYAAGVDGLRLRAREIERWWEEDGWDLLLTPTMGAAAAPLGQITGTKDDPLAAFSYTVSHTMFTSPYNVSGQPAISLPMHWSPAGLPVGMQLVAAFGREDLLFRVASQLEAAKPWADRHPPARPSSAARG